MVFRIEKWAEYKIGAGNYQTFMFRVDKSQNEYQITLNSNVIETGHDIIFWLCLYSEYKKFDDWKKNPYEYKRDASGNIVKDSYGNAVTVPKPIPSISYVIHRRTNILEKTFPLQEGVYVLIFDNTHSTITSKSIWLHVTEEWDRKTPSSSLPIAEQLLGEIPDDVSNCIMDANDCYISGHYDQCSIMLRKAIEIAIKIKLKQSNIDTKQLFDKAGNELSLSGKMQLLRKNRLITQRNSSDLEQAKWFGDIGAHGTMKIFPQDIRDIVEPKVRSFLVALNLKV